jgi:hypothetical protein
MSVEFALHVDELVEEAKDESMSRDATAIRMRNQSLIDKQSRLIADAHAQCEKAIAEAHMRMKEASLAYGTALEQQLKTLQESTITEDTLIDEMVHASQSYRDRIQQVTAIPPLIMDADRLQLQIRCAAAEEKAEDLQKELQALQVPGGEGKMERLQKELEDLQNLCRRKQGALHGRMRAVTRLEKEKLALQGDLENVKKTLNQVNVKNSSLAHQSKMDEGVMLGLKVRMETAESELERLKRKRTDSISPEHVITGILKRPADRPPPTGKDVPSSSAQPTPKKSRTRKDRWNDASSSSAPPTSSNKDGLKGRNEHASLVNKKRDPVLYNSPSSFRRKQDIIKEIEESAKTLGLSRLDSSLVFCRSTVEDQVTVTKKALAYVELLITSTCVHLMKSLKITGNPVQAYLDTLSLAQVVALQKDVDDALEQNEDRNRHMAVYRGGDNLSPHVHMQCFTKYGKPLRPRKLYLQANRTFK